MSPLRPGAPAGFVPPPPLPPGRNVLPVSPHASGVSSTLGNGTFRACPFVLPYATPIVRLGGEIIVAGEAGSALRLGVYADAGGLPGALVVDGGAIPGDAVAVAELTVAATLPPGILWIGGAVQGAPTTAPQVRVTSQWIPSVLLGAGTLNTPPGSAASTVGFAMNGVTGALPATWTGNLANSVGVAPRVWFRTA